MGKCCLFCKERKKDRFAKGQVASGVRSDLSLFIKNAGMV